jgi:hypothetical protein
MIKKMKRHVILGISLLLVGTVSLVPGQVQAASMAVLVVGLETDAASDVFAAGIRYEYTQKNYTVIDNDSVKAKLAALRQDYKDGKTVDTVGLAAWGKKNSIDFVQLVVENACTITVGSETMNGREQVVQVVRCGTEKYTGRGYYRTRLVAHEEMPLRDEEIMKDMVYVAGGVFQMLNSTYYVQLSDFHIGKYEVTQRLWKRVMGDLPSDLKGDNSSLGDNKPIVCVSWNDLMDTTGGFLKKLNDLTGKSYRLPTEAEWEYAARGCNAGSCASYVYSGSNDVEEVAWHSSNSDNTLHEIGQKLPNGLGLYDMSGNVFNWCYDWSGTYGSNTLSTPAVNPTGPTSGSNRVLRGGSWRSITAHSRIDFRYSYTPDHRLNSRRFA